MDTYWVLVKFLVVLCLVGVIAQKDQVKRRDVRHRIVIKSGRSPRSHRTRGHQHNHYHHGGPRTHKHHHDHESKVRDYSYEDNSKYYDSSSSSRESSFEDLPKYKKSHHHHKSKLRPFHSSIEFGESRPHPTKNEWTPLTSIENQVYHHYPPITHDLRSHHPSSHNHHHHPNKHVSHHKQHKRHHHHKAPLQIDLTTSFPQNPSYNSFYDSNDFPIVDDSYNFNQKIIDITKQSPLIRTSGRLSKPQKNKSIENNDSNNSYEVHENHNDDITQKKQSSFQILAPSLDATNAQLIGEESKTDQTAVKKEEKVVKQVVKRPITVRGRGRGNTRGKSVN